ncbi:MAG: histidine phosphatase family protein [Lachnospiraceae bacterium]|nr:histidine phosphatase family protein [Lachnospiraceae bacterium]
MNLYLIRHGQTDWNIEKKMQGTEDIPLNNTGKEQAAFCAKALSSISFEAIYTSPLSRAIETAEIISSYVCHPPVRIEPNLKERDFGEISGLTYQEFHQAFPDYPNTLPCGMELYHDLSARIYRAVETCAKNHPHSSILLVSHGAAINSFLYTVSGGICGSGITTLKNVCISHFSYYSHQKQFFLHYHNFSPKDFLPYLISP